MTLPTRILVVITGLALTLTFNACTPGERGATGGAVVGGALGAAVAGSGNRATGALIGGAVGAVAGSEMAKNRAYRERHHHRGSYYY